METYVSITYRSFISILHFFSFQLFQAVFFSPLDHWGLLGITLPPLSR